MWQSEVITNWQGDGLTTETANRPVVGDLLQLEGERWEDVTGQPSENLQPDPNVYVVRVRCEAATLDAIEADSRFLVVWSEEETDAI